MTPQEAAVIRAIRDLIAHRGPDDPSHNFMPTLTGGVETPLIMADISATSPIDVVGKGPSYFGVDCSSDIHHFTGGELLVSVESVKPPALFFYAAEVQVVAYVANQENILATAALNTSTGPVLVPIPLNQGYTRLSIGCRQLVNGFPSSAAFDNTPAMAGAVLTLSYSGRVYR